MKKFSWCAFVYLKKIFFGPPYTTHENTDELTASAPSAPPVQ